MQLNEEKNQKERRELANKTMEFNHQYAHTNNPGDQKKLKGSKAKFR